MANDTRAEGEGTPQPGSPSESSSHDSPGSRPSVVSYCGVTLGRDSVWGLGTNGRPQQIDRSPFSRLSVHAVVPRGAVVTQIIWSCLLFAAGVVMVSGTMKGVYILGRSIVSVGIHFAVMMSLFGTALRLFSTAWDPRHILLVRTAGRSAVFVFRPSPEPLELIKAVEAVEQRLGYVVELYPDKGASDDRSLPV